MNAIRDTPPPVRLHWADSPSGKCWCGEDATPKHAESLNPKGKKPSIREG